MPGKNSSLFRTLCTTIVKGSLLSKGDIRLYHIKDLVFLPPIHGLDAFHRFWTLIALCARDTVQLFYSFASYYARATLPKTRTSKL